jgi:peptide/nickel transport system permease protein
MKNFKLSFAGKISLIIISIYFFIAIFANVLTLYPPDKSSGERLLSPSIEHFMGTDNLAYDIWSQVAFGARVSITVGILTAFLAVFLGSTIGIFSGYVGGKWDQIIMRFVDILSSIPTLPLMILMASFMGAKLSNIIIVLAVLSWTKVARLVRSQVIMLKEAYHVKLSKLYGANLIYLIRVHFLPELLPIISISMVKQVSRAIVSEASLSFIGLGDPMSSSWGRTLNNAMNYSGIYRTDYWKWWLIAPLLSIFCLVVALSVISREIEKILH